MARGAAYAKKSQYARSIADYKELIRRDPGNAVSFAARGAAYYHLGNSYSAIVDFDDVIRIDPDYTWAINKRADIIARELAGGNV